MVNLPATEPAATYIRSTNWTHQSLTSSQQMLSCCHHHHRWTTKKTHYIHCREAVSILLFGDLKMATSLTLLSQTNDLIP